MSFTWTEAPGDWGVQDIVASWAAYPSIESDHSVIQWIYDDRSEGLGLDLMQAYTGQQKVNISGSNPLWPGHALRVYLNPGGTAVGGPVNYTGDPASISISTSIAAWELNQPFYIGATSTNTDGVPNWAYDLVIDAETPPAP